MKKISKMGLPILAMIVGLAMIVSAIAVSNTLSYRNVVGGKFVITSDWGNSSKDAGVTYSLNVTYSSPVGFSGGTLVFEFVSSGINETAISLQYLVVTTWTNATLVSEVPGDVTYSTATIPGGATGIVHLQLTYNQVGTFDMTIWVQS